MKDGAVSPQELEQWTLFLRSYQQGDFPSREQPAPPPLSPDATVEPLPAFHCAAPVYDSVELTPETVVRIRSIVNGHRFLPPPRSDLEESRAQVSYTYDLYR